MTTVHDVIKKPILSEKSLDSVGNKKYVFEVDVNANKIQIKDAVQKLFDGVKVESVHTVNCKGTFKRQGKGSGYTNKYKKAYVQLKADSKGIPFFDSLN
jgi:large subunit ribosomal protein L23